MAMYERKTDRSARAPCASAAPFTALDLAAELGAQQEAQELIGSLGDVPCVEAGRTAEGGGVWVYPNELLIGDEEADPYRHDHFCTSWVEALQRIKTYVTLFNAGPVDTSE